jgi:hypothetical protein
MFAERHGAGHGTAEHATADRLPGGDIAESHGRHCRAPRENPKPPQALRTGDARASEGRQRHGWPADIALRHNIVALPQIGHRSAIRIVVAGPRHL